MREIEAAALEGSSSNPTRVIRGVLPREGWPKRTESAPETAPSPELALGGIDFE